MTTQFKTIVTTFDAGRTAITHVRDAVFVDEQGIEAREEYDQRDPLCQHVVITSFDNRPVATGRLDIEQQGRFGRIAVLANHRRQGLGKRIVEELERLARAAGLKNAWFHAQTAAQPFYERLGYRAEGPVFDEAGIPHVRMRKEL